MAVNADLGPQIEAIVAELVRTGRFRSEVDVLREGVRLVQEREARLAALDAAIEQGVASVRAGRTKPVDAVFDRLEAKYRAKATAKR
ncbi:type II toxin-antitoxin system ParD family antitoxin [Salinarimonas chemoclinalis]|uniref:type II toxin-antitoxin system ParD family antitoxin n=1 Tax=Salinarimonas chemoclinalis TaxID=3241599 RepID=UPI003557A821